MKRRPHRGSRGGHDEWAVDVPETATRALAKESAPGRVTAAVPDDVVRRRLRQIKEMGATCVRLG